MIVKESELKLEALDIVTQAVKDCSSNPIFNLKIKDFESPGNKVKRLSDIILTNKDNRFLQEFSEEIVVQLFKIISSNDFLLSEEQEEMWSDLHKMIYNGRSYFETWNNFIKDCLLDDFLISVQQTFFSFIILNCV